MYKVYRLWYFQYFSPISSSPKSWILDLTSAEPLHQLLSQTITSTILQMLLCGVIATVCVTIRSYCASIYNRHAAQIFSKELVHQSSMQHFIFLLNFNNFLEEWHLAGRTVYAGQIKSCWKWSKIHNFKISCVSLRKESINLQLTNPCQTRNIYTVAIYHNRYQTIMLTVRLACINRDVQGHFRQPKIPKVST